MGAAERFGAPNQIRLSELAIHRWPPESKVMAVLIGYFDDSRTDGLITTLAALAGYIGSDQQWNIFQSQWSLVLDAFNLPYFHMKEFGDPDGPYKKWLPYRDHQDEIAAFFSGFGCRNF